jgi:IS5 family transposase
MPRIRDAPDLDSTPTPSTLYKAFDRLEMAVWRVLLTVSLEDLPVNGITGIDASGFERAHTSAHYTKRTNPTIQQLKTTLLVDTATNAVLDIHVSTTRKHDTQIAPQVAKRNAASISVLTGDKGYDDQKLRQLSRDHDIRPLVDHREFTPLHEA